MKVVALAGGVGAGKFLRGLVRVVPPGDLTVIVNTADDLTLHGLHISPDVDSVLYWLSGVADRERGWGRAGESFRTLEELRLLGGEAWFGLGDLDLATHLYRTEALRSGASLEEATASLARALGVEAEVIPMSNNRVETWIEYVIEGERIVAPFQTYWVAHGGPATVKGIDYRGADASRPTPRAGTALSESDVVIICPSNPVVSVAPILAVPGVREAVAARPTVGVSPIIADAPVHGMADRLMPAAGLEVTALGAARAYADVLTAWLIDERDSGLATRIAEELGIRVGTADTLMVDDEVSERVARTALELLR